jgi:hypothetical protein
MICLFVLLIHIVGTIYGSYKLCGSISSVLEVSVNVFQLILERENSQDLKLKDRRKRSPKELYVCWIVGDLGKIWFMSKLDIPKIFVATVISQIIIDFFLLVL